MFRVGPCSSSSVGSDCSATEGELSPRPPKGPFYSRSVAVDHFTSSYSSPSTHTRIPPCCGSARRIDRAASAPGSRRSHTAQLHSLQTAHLWKLNWQTHMISMRSCSCLCSRRHMQTRCISTLLFSCWNVIKYIYSSTMSSYFPM